MCHIVAPSGIEDHIRRTPRHIIIEGDDVVKVLLYCSY